MTCHRQSNGGDAEPHPIETQRDRLQLVGQRLTRESAIEAQGEVDKAEHQAASVPPLYQEAPKVQYRWNELPGKQMAKVGLSDSYLVETIKSVLEQNAILTAALMELNALINREADTIDARLKGEPT